MNQGEFFKKIGFNTIAQIAGKAISLILGFITVALLTRYLGVAGYGDFALIFAYLSFFGIISDFGLQLTIVRELSKRPEKIRLLYGTYFWVKFFLVILSTLFALFALILFPYSYSIKIGIIIGAIAVGIGGMINFGTAIFQSRIRVDLITLVDTLTKVITVLFIGIFVYFNLGLYVIITAVLLGNLIGFFITAIILKKLTDFNFIFDFGTAKKIILFSLPIGFTSLLSLAYFKIDILLLSILRNNTDVGIYSFSYKILENILMLWGFYMASIYPLMSKFQGSGDFTNFLKLFKNSLVIVLILSLTIIIVGYILAPIIITIFGGQEFNASILPFRILLFSIPLFFINNLFYHLFLVIRKTKVILFGMGFALFMNLLFNFIYIPKGGYIAASYVTLLSEVVVLVIYIICLKYFSRLSLSLK